MELNENGRKQNNVDMAYRHAMKVGLVLFFLAQHLLWLSGQGLHWKMLENCATTRS